jgi:transposase InsO family protein
MPLKSDPGRLPRRNHYQEGPGFLFLATQGGRPPGSVAPSASAGIIRRRAAALRRWREGEPIAGLCAELGVHRATLFRWRSRLEEAGLVGLADPVHVGRASTLDPVLERVILMVRLLTNWSSRRIAAEFERRGVAVGHGQIDRLFARYGTHRSSAARIPGPRYERSSPNELWHIDLKGPFYLPTATGGRRSCHFVALVDDFSRYLLGIHAVPTKEAVPVLETLAEAIDLCGVPLALMSDNGTPFVTIVRTMLSRFQRTLAELEIRHIRTQVDTPWTNGKVEAFWATLQAEVLDRQYLADLAAADAAVVAYASYYNYHRLHGELGWRTPAERFDGTPFTDRGFEHVPALAPVADLLAELLAQAA